MRLHDKILKDFLIGKSDEAGTEAVLAWLDESEENADRLFRAEELRDAGRLDYARRSEAAERRLRLRIASQEAARKRNIFLKPLSYAASVCLVAALGLFLGKTLRSSDEPFLTAVADAGVKELVLSDGTKVWLNASSSLSYPAIFGETTRAVRLQGEAYFEVTKDPDRPFVVSSEGMDVKVLGTSFNFNTRVDGNVEEVALIDGKVQACGRRDEGKITLIPGQKAILDKGSGQMLVKQAPVELDAVWHDALIPFRNANIETIAKVLERFYPVKIVIGTDVDREATYSGIISKHGSLDSVLSALTYSIPVKYVMSGSSVYMERE